MAEQINPDPNALPEDLTELTDEQLDAAEQAARDEAEALVERDDLTPADVERLEYLTGTDQAEGYLDRVAAQRTANETAAQEQEARLQAARDRLNPPEDSTSAPEGDSQDADGEDESDDAGDGAPESGGEEQPADEGGEQEPQAVAAGGGRQAARAPQMRRAPRRVEPVQPETGRMHTITASAEVGIVPSGHEMDRDQLVQAFIKRGGAFPRGTARQKGVRSQLEVATIHRNFGSTQRGLHQDNRDFADDLALLDAATDERALSGGSLLASRRLARKAAEAGTLRGPVAASGGWCAPSETLYDLTSDESLDGIIDLPTVGVTRGGINFTTGPDFSDIYTSAGFAQTEAEAIAGDTKDCVEVDCPDFGEVRLDAVGICVKAPLLTNAAYPELVRRWIDGTEVANEHKVAARLITSMRTLLGSALAPTLTGTPVTWSTLTAMELVIEGQRQAYRLSESQTLEVKAPRWLRVAIRADLANRMGIGAESVSNAQIATHFADRGADVQWILNYLELSSPKTVVAFPSTAEIMVYPAGTFVRGNADVINLSAVYDTASLQTNVYTAAFVEDGVLIAKKKNGGARITLPVNVNGMLGSAQLDDNWGTAQAESAGA